MDENCCKLFHVLGKRKSAYTVHNTQMNKGFPIYIFFWTKLGIKFNNQFNKTVNSFMTEVPIIEKPVH